MKLNPPPGWPPPPPGWVPPVGWTPDPQWPPVPLGWQLWVPEKADSPGEQPLQLFAQLYSGDTHARFEVLLGVVTKLAQEVAALRLMVQNADKSYREAVVEIKVNDHGGPGPSGGFEFSTLYPYLISEDSFLRNALRLSDAEMDQFHRAAAERASLS